MGDCPHNFWYNIWINWSFLILTCVCESVSYSYCFLLLNLICNPLGMRSSCEILVFIDLRKALSGTVTNKKFGSISVSGQQPTYPLGSGRWAVAQILILIHKFYNMWLTCDLFVPVLFNIVIFLFLFCFWILFILFYWSKCYYLNPSHWSHIIIHSS